MPHNKGLKHHITPITEIITKIVILGITTKIVTTIAGEKTEIEIPTTQIIPTIELVGMVMLELEVMLAIIIIAILETIKTDRHKLYTVW